MPLKNNFEHIFEHLLPNHAGIIYILEIYVLELFFLLPSNGLLNSLSSSKFCRYHSIISHVPVLERNLRLSRLHFFGKYHLSKPSLSPPHGMMNCQLSAGGQEGDLDLPD